MEKREKKLATEREGWKTRLTRRYGMLPYTSERERVSVMGGRRACVYGCRRILFYSPTEIRLLMAKEELSVLGRGLYCSSFSSGTVTVEGEIGGVLYGAYRRAFGKDGAGEL